MVTKKKSAKSAKNAASLEQAPPPAVAMTLKNLPEGFKIKRSITVPTLNLKVDGEARILKINTPMHLSTITNKPTADKRQMEPATVCNVTDVQSGELFTWLVPSVVKSNLERDYPEDAYVGCKFYIINKGKRTPSQRYRDFEIHEIE